MILATLIAGAKSSLGAMLGRNGLLLAAIAGLVTFYWLADNSAAQRGRAQAIAEQGKPTMTSMRPWLKLGGSLSILALAGCSTPMSETTVKPRTRVVVGSFAPIAASPADSCATQIAVAKAQRDLRQHPQGKAVGTRRPASARRRQDIMSAGAQAYAPTSTRVDTAAAPT